MKFTRFHTVLAIASSTLYASSAFASFPSFDDLTLGDSYVPSQNFTSDGVNVKLMDFQDGKGNWHNSGVATVSDALMANGSMYELNTDNINSFYDYAGSIGTQTEVEFLFGEYGGNINFAVNGDFVNKNNFIELDGLTIGGCSISVPFGGFGGDTGKVVIIGAIQNMLVGGQELAVDVHTPDECEPSFEDLPLGMSYFIGDTFTTNLVPCEVATHLYLDGTPASGGYVMVEDWNQACGDNQELFTNNAAVVFKFAMVSPIENFSYYFGEYGGNINMAINGDFRNVPDYIHLDGMVIGGVTVNVTSGGYGDDCGTIEFDGNVNEFAISGQEHFIDCFLWDWLQLDECEPSYEDLIIGDVYVVGDIFTTGDYTYKTSYFTWEDGTNWNGGDVTVENTGQACSIGNELHYDNATTKIFRTSGDWMTNVSFKFGEYGGNINLEINGDFANFYDFIDIDGSVIGGVTVTVDYGGTGGDCGQVSFTGDIEDLRVGGQEFFVDCFYSEATTAPSIPGDVDGDGDVDLADLLALIAAWGSGDAAADVNGDGVVNTADLLILIANWGS